MRTIPRNAGHARILGDDGTANFIPQGMHGRTGRTNELNGRVRLGKRVGEGGFFGGVAPPCPDGVYAVQTGQFDDEGDVGVVVIVGTAGDVDYDVGHADVFGVGSGMNIIIWCGEEYE